MILGSHLKFENHVKMIKQKIIPWMQTIKKIRWTLTIKDAMTLYIRPKLYHFFDLGSIFYESANKNLLTPFQRMQNKALHSIIPRKHCLELNQHIPNADSFPLQKEGLKNHYYGICLKKSSSVFVTTSFLPREWKGKLWSLTNWTFRNSPRMLTEPDW